MIDARRMEVFTALYSKTLELIKQPVAMTVDEKSFDENLVSNTICFFGNGSDKFQQIKNNSRAIFKDLNVDASSMIELTEGRFQERKFADLAYAEPLYLKEFYTPTR